MTQRCGKKTARKVPNRKKKLELVRPPLHGDCLFMRDTLVGSSLSGRERLGQNKVTRPRRSIQIETVQEAFAQFQTTLVRVALEDERARALSRFALNEMDLRAVS